MNGKQTRRKSVKLYKTYAGVNWLEHYTAYEGTPPVTRFFGTACFLVNIATFFGLINVFHFVFDLQSVIQKYEYWRFLTSFLHFGFAFGSPVVTPPVRYIFVLVQFHRYMLNLENFYF